MYIAKYRVIAVMWCDSPDSHTHLSTSLTLLTLTAENAEPLVSSTDNEPIVSVASDLFFSLPVSNSSFSDGHPSHSENTYSFLSCLLLTSSTHLVYLALLVDARAVNAVGSTAVISVCNPFLIIHSFSDRLLIVHLLSSSNSQTLLNWYSGPTVARICPCSSSVGMSCDPC